MGNPVLRSTLNQSQSHSAVFNETVSYSRQAVVKSTVICHSMTLGNSWPRVRIYNYPGNLTYQRGLNQAETTGQ